jgi:hypothetical protein
MNVCTPTGFSGLGTALGLSQLTGVSPYFPLLALAVSVRWFHYCHLNHSFLFITSNWFMLLIAILAIANFFLDKILGANSIWHAIHVGISPIIGGLITVATAQNVIPGISMQAPAAPLSMADMAMHLSLLSIASGGLHLTGTVSVVVLFIVGAFLAGIAQFHRFIGRGITNIFHLATAGISNVIVSLIEDVVVCIGVLLAFFTPFLMLIVVIIVTLLLLSTLRTLGKGTSLLLRRGRTSKRF